MEQKSSQSALAVGAKHDDGKLPYELVPWDSMDEVVKVLQFGAKKYEPRNWEKGMEWTRPAAAAIRHVKDFLMGVDQDPETKLHPLAHAICELMFVLAYALRHMRYLDNRAGKPWLADPRWANPRPGVATMEQLQKHLRREPCGWPGCPCASSYSQQKCSCPGVQHICGR